MCGEKKEGKKDMQKTKHRVKKKPLRFLQVEILFPLKSIEVN